MTIAEYKLPTLQLDYKAPLKTPEEIKAYLITQGVLPTPEEAKRIYWSLGKDWWKQLIDGWAQKYGPLVFDLGLHTGPSEPGYLKGLKTASLFFTDNFDEPFSLELYKAIHAHACSHFATSKPFEDSGVIDNLANVSYRTIKERSTYCFSHYQPLSPEMQQYSVLSDMRNTVSDAVGAIEDEQTRATIANLSLEVNGFYKRIATQPAAELETLQKNSQSAVHKAKNLLESLSFPHIPDDPKELCSVILQKESELMPKIVQQAEDYIQKMNQYFDSTFGANLMVECHFRTIRSFYIVYPCSTPSRQESITQRLIDIFDARLMRLQKETCRALQANAPLPQAKQAYQEKVCRLIADLFAQLEWAHPWTDGQGRTDLVVLNGLLCQAGLHPAILDDPYYSTGCPVDQWLSYLKAGLKKWEELKG